MRMKNVQMSLLDTYNDVCETMENNKPKFLALMEKHIDFRALIPAQFLWAFYSRFGRPREYSLESFLRFLVLQKILGIEKDSAFLAVLNLWFTLK